MKSKSFKAIAAALVCTAGLSATPIGTMSLGIVVSGGVTVSGTRIDFFPPSSVGGPPNNGDFATGNPTSISYNNGSAQVLTPTTDPFGYISDLDVTPSVFPPGGVNFILFSVTQGGAAIPDLSFDITGIGPGGTAQNALNGCAGVTGVGVRCSPTIAGYPGGVSPFVLTDNGTGTDISLTVSLLGHDATGSIAWLGGFTTQNSGTTPADIQAALDSGSIFDNTWSFTARSVAAAPEPGTMAILGSGLLLVGLAAWRRKSRLSL